MNKELQEVSLTIKDNEDNGNNNNNDINYNILYN